MKIQFPWSKNYKNPDTVSYSDSQEVMMIHEESIRRSLTIGQECFAINEYFKTRPNYIAITTYAYTHYIKPRVESRNTYLKFKDVMARAEKYETVGD